MQITSLTSNAGGDFAGEVSGIDLTRPLWMPTSPRSRPAWTASPCWCSTTSASTTRPAGVQPPLRRTGNLLGRGDEQAGGPPPEAGDGGHLQPDRNNRLREADDRVRLGALGNRLWHSDASFRAIPAKYSLLSARVVPGTGGNTEFADMRAAYDALDDATKRRSRTWSPNTPTPSRAKRSASRRGVRRRATRTSCARCATAWCARIR